MIKYTIFPNEGGVACKMSIPQTKHATFLVTKKEFDDMIAKFQKQKYKIKIGESSIHLYGSKSKITIMEYKEMINHPLLKSIKEDIIRKVSTDGFSTAQSKKPKHLSTKPNRSKSNKNAGQKIVKASTYTLLSVLMISVITSNIGNTTDNRGLESIKTSVVELSDINTVDETLVFDNNHSTESHEKGTFQEHSTEFHEESTPQKKTETRQALIFEFEPENNRGFIEFEDLSDTDKAIATKENYYDIICDCEKAYGLDEKLILGIATQERGVHSSEIDAGGGLGLMQIQYNVWINQKLDYYEYNEETESYDYHEMIVTDEIMRNLKSNIHTGAKILQKCLRMADYNIPVAIQMYNQGYGSVKKIITAYAKEHGKTYEEVLANPEDLGWLDYRYMKAGDPKYIENVIKWIDENTFTITNVKDSSVIKYTFENIKEVQNDKVMN